eukprot:TRINITY_DN4650_c0_g5_i1.p1 TRINITY_DN4650_c0_g5~~TRINITY_DN4650_c0_g5_i1.p1  ORF type:complete len:847 (+),score=199.62 TRINITY_DN4650_c0_g5_i1:419-2959(+)
MEISFLKALINNISEFSRLSSSNNIKSEPIQSYHQKIDEALKLLRLILDEIVDSEISSDEGFNEALKELNAVVNEARDLIEGWQQMTSKLYFVLQIESLMAKMQKYGVEICGLVNSLLPSITLTSDLLSIQQCVQMFQLIVSEQTSDVIKESMRYVQENAVPSSESLLKIANSLSLISNQELLLEAVALEKVKTKVEHDRIYGSENYVDYLIALVTLMHDSLTKTKRCHTINGVSVPADFCCPLSLELMSNPVIVASGQTYERAYIRRWLDQGLAVCPKTRQTLSHTNLIPNYTVKALIANWCELHNIKLPDPIKSVSSNQSQVLPHLDCNAGDPLGSQAGNASGISVSPESIKYVVGSQSHRSVSSNVNHKHDKSTSPLHLNSFSKGRAPLDTPNGLEVDIGRVSLGSAKDVETVSDGRSAGSDGQALVSTREDLSEVSRADEQCPSHNQSTSFSSAISSSDCQQGAGYANEASRLSGDLSNSSSHASSELTSEALGPALVPALAPAPDPPSREKEFSSRLAVARSKSHNIWRRPSAILFSRMASSPASVSRPDLSGVETQVRKLIEDLQSGSGDLQRDAAAELRLLAKHSMDNRIVIANCGAIDHLVHLLHSADLKTQENAVTALLNLSINDNNKISIVNAGAIDPLIHVLKTGNAEAKENSAATLFSLSVIEENKVKIGRSGAIRPLVELLGNGTPRGKKDAATALFNLSIFHENKVRIVQAGAVKCLVELMDPAAGMADKAVAVLANISTIPEGRNAIGQEGGIPVLVEVVELGSSRGKENAAAALLQLCTNNVKFCTMALQEGVVPPLVALSQSGTPRAKEKAQALLSYFRSQRHGNARRA